MPRNLAIYCVDVGSIARNFGWARVDGDEIETGTRIDDLAARLSKDITAGRPTSIG